MLLQILKRAGGIAIPAPDGGLLAQCDDADPFPQLCLLTTLVRFIPRLATQAFKWYNYLNDLLAPRVGFTPTWHRAHNLPDRQRP